jgi:hypothetical protein
MATKNRPVHQIRLGRIKAVIWANDTASGKKHNVNLTRIYKDGEQWKTSDSLGREDLLLASKALDLAHTWIFEALAPSHVAPVSPA